MQAEALTEMGKLLHKQRDYRRARTQLQTAVDLQPDSLQVRRALRSLRPFRDSVASCPDASQKLGVVGHLDVQYHCNLCCCMPSGDG